MHLPRAVARVSRAVAGGDVHVRRAISYLQSAVPDLTLDVTGELQLWTFQVNDRARRFYARNGFVEVRKFARFRSES